MIDKIQSMAIAHWPSVAKSHSRTERFGYNLNDADSQDITEEHIPQTATGEIWISKLNGTFGKGKD